jgi:hypothetical protein
LSTKLTTIFSHRNKHQKVNCFQKTKIKKQETKRKRKKNSKIKKEKRKKELPFLPRSCGCPTNPFHPFFFRI